jgi:hypothetical protein
MELHLFALVITFCNAVIHILSRPYSTFYNCTTKSFISLKVWRTGHFATSAVDKPSPSSGPVTSRRRNELARLATTKQ